MGSRYSEKFSSEDVRAQLVNADWDRPQLVDVQQFVERPNISRVSTKKRKRDLPQLIRGNKNESLPILVRDVRHGGTSFEKHGVHANDRARHLGKQKLDDRQPQRVLFNPGARVVRGRHDTAT